MQKKGRSSQLNSSKNFIVKLPASGQAGHIVVSKKIAKKAVDRNRIKRIIKEALRKLGGQKGESSIIVRNNIAGFKTEQVYEELKKILKRSQ